MAASSAANQFSLLLLIFITLLSSLHISHARDSRFFSKISSTNNNNNVVTNKEQTLNNNPQQQEELNFLPENENGYGLYGHESGQLPPSATTTKGEPATSVNTVTTTKGEPTTTVNTVTTTKGEPATTPTTVTTTKGEPATTVNTVTTTKGEPTTTTPNTVTTRKGEPATTTPNTVTTTKGEPTTAGTTGISDTTPYKKYLPKNYNPVAYITEPEDITDSNALTEETYATDTKENNNYYNAQQEEEEETREPEYRGSDTTAGNNYYSGGDSFNGNPQGMRYTMFMGGATRNRPENYFNDAGKSNRFQPEGMSDTRAVKNGKYFYDLHSEKYGSNHPYESLRGVRERNYYENSENSMGGYEDQYEFQNEENMP